MAKEKQVLMDLEQGIKQTGFNNKEPQELILDLTKENETGYGNHGTAQEAIVSTTTQPDSTFSQDSCIYRVPNRLRSVNPDAYTPQMLLIGPLHHHYKKAQALELSKTDCDLRYSDYKKMEIQKKKYLNRVAHIYGDQTIEELRRIIQRDEIVIRKRYAESTDWISSQEFQEMILHDSVFILWFFIQTGTEAFNRKEDVLFEEPYLIATIIQDLILLENQLPYDLLEELFEPFLIQLRIKGTFRDITLRVFGLDGMIEKKAKFLHFTDLFRSVRVEPHGFSKAEREQGSPPIFHVDKIYANQLENVGILFNYSPELTLGITFEAGILRMSSFTVDDNTERVIRNLIALEQCHYSYSAFVTNYIAFLDILIDTEQDADLLIKEGVVKNLLRPPGSVTEMVKKLLVGIYGGHFHYYKILKSLNEYSYNRNKKLEYYDYRIRRSLGTLRQVYFKDLWTGTATVGAVIIVVLTLIGTVASVLQVMQNSNNATKGLNVYSFWNDF